MAQTVNFAPIRNPANKDRVFIYRVAPSVQTLGYDQRTIGQVSNTTRWNKDPITLPSTRLLATSNIVALDFDDVVHVYGVAQDSNLITLISPFTEQLGADTKAPKGALAGCVQREGGVVNKVYLAYQSGVDGSLMWCDVTEAEAQDTKSTAENQAAGTALSTFFDTKRFWLMYQDTKGRLTAHNEKDQQATRVFGDSAFFIKNTPIGSCFIPKYKEGTLGRAIVYWVRKVNDSNVLYRSHADITEDEATANWSEPKPATSAGQNVQPGAQIGIIVDNAKQSNIIYLSKEGNKDNITPVTDSWKAKGE